MSNHGNSSEPGVALVTGAGKRIGRAIAEDLAGRGWTVAVHYSRSAAAAESVAASLRARGAHAEPFQADLADEAETGALVARVTDALGPVTLLVNNASTFEHDSVADATRDSWDRHMAVNLRAPFVLIQGFAHLLGESGTGNVVNIIDQRVWNLTPHFVTYTLSKSGLWTLTRTLALALAPRIRVNAIGPGPTLPSKRQSEDQFRRQYESVPLARPTEPGEICAGLTYILTAPAMTGQMIALDGGQHMGWAQAPADTPPDE